MNVFYIFSKIYMLSNYFSLLLYLFFIKIFNFILFFNSLECDSFLNKFYSNIFFINKTIEFYFLLLNYYIFQLKYKISNILNL
jgi:hypothetical protein